MFIEATDPAGVALLLRADAAVEAATVAIIAAHLAVERSKLLCAGWEIQPRRPL